MNHSFDIDRAIKYGVPQAILLENMLFWLAHNKAFGKNIHEGKVWTFNSVAAYAELFPYWTGDQIRRYFESLERAKVLITGNFNKKKYDKTKWHTVADQALIPLWQISQRRKSQKDLAESPDALGESAEPIPDINTDKKVEPHADAWTPPPFKDTKTSKKKPISIHPEYSTARALMIELDNNFMENKTLREHANKAIKKHGIGSVLSAIRGRALASESREKWWAYLFMDEVAFQSCIDRDKAESKKLIDMRERFSPQAKETTAEERAALEKALSAL